MLLCIQIFASLLLLDTLQEVTYIHTYMHHCTYNIVDNSISLIHLLTYLHSLTHSLTHIGQVAVRYGFSNQLHESVVSKGIMLRYGPANPSHYPYLDDKRVNNLVCLCMCICM